MDDNKKTFKVLPDIEANLEFTADDGVIIKYMDLGEDKTNPDQHTVVLVHGLTANSKMWGDAVVSTGYSGANVVGILVENGFRVLISDLRGHGLSGKPRKEENYGMNMVTDQIKMLDEIKVTKAHFVGYSLGAEIILRLGVTYPERILSLSLGGSAWSTMKLTNETYRAAWAQALFTISPYCCCCCYDKSETDCYSIKPCTLGMNKINGIEADELKTITVPVQSYSGEKDPELKFHKRMIGILPENQFSLFILPQPNCCVGFCIDGHSTALGNEKYRQVVLEFLLNVRNGKGVLNPIEMDGIEVTPLAPKVLEKMGR